LVGCVAIIGSSRLALEPQAVSQGGDERETALLPPSFGKTTLLRKLIGALRAMVGTVTLNGTDITRAAPNARGRLGISYVPQVCEIFPVLSVTDNPRMGLVKTGQEGSDGID
jgi:ABC-type branched-subunit amino acid transport system ATPase component